MSLLFGATNPLQPPPPTPKDIVESEHMVEAMLQHVVVNTTRAVLGYIESVAAVMVTLCNLKRQQQLQQLCDPNAQEEQNNETLPSWAKAFAFGSSGLEANVASSDIDVYVGRVPNIAP
jgi:hypothetical protein